MGHPHCEAPAVRARRWSLAALPLLAGRLHGRFLGLETSAWQYILCFPITCCVFHPRLISRGFESCLARNLFGSLQTWLDSSLCLLFSGHAHIVGLRARHVIFPGLLFPSGYDPWMLLQELTTKDLTTGLNFFWSCFVCK